MKVFSALIIGILFSMGISSCSPKKKEYDGWPHYGGTKEMIRYSTLAQVDTSNVQQLKVAWTYNTGDADTANHSQIQCNPIVIDGILYGTTPKMKVFAVDAGTGRQKWVFNPFDSLQGNKKMFFVLNNSRGVTYWSDGKEDKRIFFYCRVIYFLFKCSEWKIGHFVWRQRQN